MSPAELGDWLETDESKGVGDSSGGESTGHASGRKILKIKKTNKGDLTRPGGHCYWARSHQPFNQRLTCRQYPIPSD
ncbi:DUF3140 domain-containing protein [Halomonas sp. D1-1]|uniref:DUF3140 domain-containing protein n=2 Tax=Halomonas icarae TaxID=2691040 RepID=A0A7X4W1Z6_9GAMM|nr:DUF3140 domain-containing protein [Halomonas icarae]